MLENYRKAINPASLLEVVPKEVLRSHLQAFFYGLRAGTVLIYDEGRDANGDFVLKRLEPVEDSSNDEVGTVEWRERFKNFNPFCAKFRDEPKRNAMCEKCDKDAALKQFEGQMHSVRYDCHMNLIDMTYPIKIGKRVRGVLFGGQKIIREDQKQKQRIITRVRQVAFDLASELEDLADQSANSALEVDAFEQGFRKFGEAMQSTVDAFIRSYREESEREALIEISNQLDQDVVSAVGDWVKPARQLLSDLQPILSNNPLWLLQRRGSRYQCAAATGETISGNQSSNLSVATMIALPLEKLVNVDHTSPIYREVSAKLEITFPRLSLIRSDAPSGDHDVVSLILVVPGDIEPDQQRMLIGCVKTLAYPAGVARLLERLEIQQKEFARRTSFTGHHLKTPIQAALNSLHEAKLRLPDSSPEKRSIEKAESQMLLGLADTLRLQDAAIAPQREDVDIYAMIKKISDDLVPLSRQRQITLQIEKRQEGIDYSVVGVAPQLRVAFTNLLDNAIKYAFESSWVSIKFDVIHPEGERPSRPFGVLLVRIEDVGVGFPLEKKDQMFNLGARFDPSSGTNYARPGSGIGLVQAKEYLENCGGSLDIDSNLVPMSQQKYKVTAIVHLPLKK